MSSAAVQIKKEDDSCVSQHSKVKITEFERAVKVKQKRLNK